MSTLKTTFIQHPSAEEPAIEMQDNGNVVLPFDAIGVMKFADAAARDTALGTEVASGNALREGMLAYNQDDAALQIYDGTEWKAVGVAEIDPIVATGGDEVYEFLDGGIVYNAHVFENSDDFVVSSAPGGTAIADVLIVAGGGGGGGTSQYAAAGGGAGGLIMTPIEVTATTYPIVIGNGGAGGAAGFNNGTKGTDSTAFSLTAEGGGYGARSNGSSSTVGGDGGSGGGGQAAKGGEATLNQGTDGNAGSGAARGGMGGGALVGGLHNGGATGGGLPGRGPDLSDKFGKFITVGRGSVQSAYGASAGAPGVGYGGGGGGGESGASGSKAGGAGAAGVVIIRYPVRYV